MIFRNFLAKLVLEGILKKEDSPISLQYELADYMYKNKEVPTFFPNLGKGEFRLASGICSQRELMAMGLGIQKEEMLHKLSWAFENPSPNPIVEKALCQEKVSKEVDLFCLPIPHFFPKDGGPYISAGVVITRHPEWGLNASYHRLMLLDKNSFTLRIVEGRHTHAAYCKSNRHLQAAVCIGNSQAVMLAASMSPEAGIFEMNIANSLDPTPLVQCKTKDLLVPADCEIVLEGWILDKTTSEGPFVDLTGTYDFVRQQPIFQVDCITYRENPIFQSLLPGQNEHKLLMGMLKEPTLYSQINKVVSCKNVVLTPGGCCWFHAVIQICKKHPDDGIKALKAAFEGHKSLKHAVVVDEDIDIYNSQEIEWAIATRFQADRDMLVLTDEPSSSLDPSAKHTPGQKSKTAKLGIDATIHDTQPREKFTRVSYFSNKN